MNFYILGIFLVLMMSVGFSALQSSYATQELAAEAVEDLNRPAPWLAARPSVAQIGSTEVAAALTSVERPDARLIPAKQAEPKYRSSIVASERRVVKKTAAPLNDTIIYYSVLNHRQPEAPELSASVAEPKRKGKSFLSKTFSVVKQPYKWLKAVASKLD